MIDATSVLSDKCKIYKCFHHITAVLIVPPIKITTFHHISLHFYFQHLSFSQQMFSTYVNISLSNTTFNFFCQLFLGIYIQTKWSFSCTLFAKVTSCVCCCRGVTTPVTSYSSSWHPHHSEWIDSSQMFSTELRSVKRKNTTFVQSSGVMQMLICMRSAVGALIRQHMLLLSKKSLREAIAPGNVSLYFKLNLRVTNKSESTLENACEKQNKCPCRSLPGSMKGISNRDRFRIALT